MLRRGVAIFIALHGLIHLIGFAVPWKLAVFDGLPYSTSAVFGLVEMGDAGARALAIVWLGTAVAFVVGGVAIWQRRGWAAGWTAASAVISAVVCFLGLPSSAFGLLVDVVIVGAFVLLGPARTRVTPLWSRTQPSSLHPPH